VKVWSVNPDNDSVSVLFTPHGDILVAEVPVGKEPWCVAITPDDTKLYVTNMRAARSR
jgi:DNA-binding beta-propeller fold protein YncE